MDGLDTTFARDTSVRRVGPGSFLTEMVPTWWIIAGPNGGYVAASILRALVAEVGELAAEQDPASRPTFRPRSMTLQYLRPPVAGEARIHVTLERIGRTVVNASVRMTQDDRLLVMGLAALCTDRPAPISFDDTEGLPTVDGAPPRSPDEIAFVEVDPERDVPMRQHYDMRWALGDLPFQAGEAPRRARCGGWLRLAEGDPIDEIALAAMTDAWMPPIFCRVDQPLAVPTIDLTIHFRALPADPHDFCFAEFVSPLSADGYLVEDGKIWDRSGRLLVESRQMAVVA